MFSKLAAWMRERYIARKKAGSLILIGELKAEAKESLVEAKERADEAKERADEAKERVVEATAALITAKENLAEIIKRQIRRGEDGTCTCGQCRVLIPQRKEQLESIERKVNALRMKTAPREVQEERIMGAEPWRTVLDTASSEFLLGRPFNRSQVKAALAEGRAALAGQLGVDVVGYMEANLGLPLRRCRMRLARARFPIVLFPRLWVLLESCVAAKSEPILADGLDFLLAKYLQCAKSSDRRWCDIEYALKAVALVLSCAWDDAKETVQRAASRCWWLLIFAERVLKLATHIWDLLGGGR
jgi:hypothetical protein